MFMRTSLLKWLWASFAVVWIIFGAWFFLHKDQFLQTPVTIAVIDTGSNRPGAVGENLFNKTVDIRDNATHGTIVEKIILQWAPQATILTFKVTATGAGATPESVATAVDDAVEQGARLIHFSIGLKTKSDVLQSALEKAERTGSVLVAAAGQGVDNPFRPDALKDLLPQSFPKTVVVGQALASDKADSLLNFGPELDIVLVPLKGGVFLPGEKHSKGSSFAAGIVSGLIARAMIEMNSEDDKKFVVQKAKACVRSFAKMPNAARGNWGAGLFDPATFSTANFKKCLVSSSSH